MEHIVFLAHRIPFPPNKGDKIRSYHMLNALCKRYRVHLGCFVDDPDDWQHLDTLKTLCASVCCLPLERPLGYLRGLRALTNGHPITLPFYRSGKMQRWVDRILDEHQVTRALVFSSSMAQYLEGDHCTGIRRVIDFVDVDSDKWAQYARQKRGLARWVYQREHRTLRHYENRIAERFDRAIFVSHEEACLFRKQLTDTTGDKVCHLLNGVDTHYFDPHARFDRRPAAGGPFIAFTGAMDYWANADAVSWFCEAIWPQIRAHHPELRFLIVGGNPGRAVTRLEHHPGVRVTGRVADIRPYIAGAELIVAPLRIARGIQNKVLEAMAMGKPVVATSMAMEGIRYNRPLCIEVADEPQAYAEACLRGLTHQYPARPGTNRDWVLREFSWEKTLAGLHGFFEEGGA